MMDYPIVFRLMFVLKIVTECHYLSRSVCHVQCFMFNPNIPCLDSIGFPNLFDSIESYDLTQLVLSVDLNKFSLIPHYLFLLIIYTPVFLSSPPLGRW